MFVIHNCIFTPDLGGFDQILIPGVYTADQFSSITNITKNAVLYVSTDEHLGTILVSNDGVQTTVLVYPATVDSQSTDELQVLAYNDAPGTSPGPAANVAVTNFPASQNINGAVTVNGEVEVKNDAGSPLTVSGTVSVGNFPATQPVSGTVSVSNFPATQAVSGTVTANQGTSPWVTSVNNFPATQSVTQGTSPWVVSGTVNSNSTVSSFPLTSTDAFGRLRVSQPYTMFDSQHRYADNNLWATFTATGGTAVFNAAQGLMDLNVTAASGSQVLRETVRTFAYQPGKSLQVMTTFVMAPPKTGLTQRVGYYNVGNGFFVELNDNLASLCFVERSSVTGSVTNTRISQLGGVYGAGDTGWNVDPMNGTGPSGITLDITKAQILWMDIEWLGVGTVRMGFVINGQFYICHEWDHANLITSTYITTASLPMRCEILNVAATTGPSTFKQICGTVISEGGYVLTGSQQSIGTPIVTPRTLTVAGVAYPMVSLRLKATKLDAICILSAVSIMGNGNNEKFQWNLEQDDAVIGGTWVSAGPDSAVEYNLTATSTSGGRTLGSGYISSSNQGSPTVNIFKADLFQFQLERNPFTNTPYSLTLTLAGANNTTSAYTSMDWEEVCR